LDLYDRFANRIVLEAVLVFVVAHEIAHIILKHCSTSNSWVAFELTSAERAMTTDWQMELSADSLAIRILEQWCFLRRFY